jgi:energy-coupling factor transporter transmembrane protein EcfT
VNPLIIKAMRQALDMGLVMDARAFGAYKTRRWITKEEREKRKEKREKEEV